MSAASKQIIALFSALAVAAANAPSVAQDASPEQLKKIEERLNEQKAGKTKLNSEARARKKELEKLGGQLVETATALKTAEADLKQRSEEIEKLQISEDETADLLKTQQANLSDVLAALQSLERARPPALLISPDDANKAARAAMLLSDAAPALAEKAEDLRATLAEYASIREKLEQERRALRKTNEEIAARRDLLSELIAKKQAERDVAERLASAAQRETAALAARATTMRGMLSRLERFARSITPRIKPPPPPKIAPGAVPDAPIARAPSRKPRPPALKFSPPKSFSAAKGVLSPPVFGRQIGAYGARRPEGGKYDGVRYVADDQAIVTAPFDAYVEFARSWDLLGNLIVLDVGEGYHILLIGVGSFMVEEGQEVAAGEPLGAMSGAQARLDMEINKNGESVNPSLWLSSKNKGDAAY